MSDKQDLLNVHPPQPRKGASESDLASLITQHLRQLPEFHRKVLALRYHEGLCLSEIAEVTGVCPSLVREVHRRAMTAIDAACSEHREAA